MDYQELIERLRNSCEDAIQPDDVYEAADLIEQLQAENERLKAELAKYRDAPVKPRFECWSTNDGDSWYENPDDAELIYDVLGNNAKVGDEFEVMAGWCNVQARYRIVSEKDDDFEVECISHDFDNIPLIVKPGENK